MPRSRKAGPTSITWSGASDCASPSESVALTCPSGHLNLSFELGTLHIAEAEAAAEACGALAVTFSDAADDPVLEPLPGEFRLWRHTRVQCLFDAPGRPAAADALQARLAQALGIEPQRITARTLPMRAWEREWLRDFHAMRFGRRLWVAPWHADIDATDAAVVRLDPGLAFGTGTHPSTALCLEYLDAHCRPGVRAIDYGCGSGVLALAAAKLGAAMVHCFDIDPQALLATSENAQANGVSACVQVHAAAADLPAGCDLLLANILSGPLCELAPSFARLLRPGGRVVLAGLMDGEAADVTGAYAPWFHVTRSGARDGWVCLSGPLRNS
ncbi:MAG: 50S ribosomal protein L11 methyltransferase [Proteobacteria bacterium]|nr:50S ribosomal protein L11 methyltransferase [Pseudomonadota bacterium]